MFGRIFSLCFVNFCFGTFASILLILAMATSSGVETSDGFGNEYPQANDQQNVFKPMETTESIEPQIVSQPMVNDELQEITVKDMISSWVKDNMNISMAFKKIVANDPERHKQLFDAVHKTFEETNESIDLEEFKSMLGDLSFLKNKKNVANLYATLQSQFNDRMGSSFEKITESENLWELFNENNELNQEEQKKYSIDNEYKELDNTLRMLDNKIFELEKTNEVLLNQAKFNRKRHKHLNSRITKLMEKCEVAYVGNLEQSEVIRKEISSMLTK